MRQRTQCVNALRGHLLEFGYVFPQGVSHVAALVAVVEDLQSSLPESMRTILKLLVDTFTALDGQIAALDAEINRRSKADPTARRLMTIPGVGPIVSTADPAARAHARVWACETAAVSAVMQRPAIRPRYDHAIT